MARGWTQQRWLPDNTPWLSLTFILSLRSQLGRLEATSRLVGYNSNSVCHIIYLPNSYLLLMQSLVQEDQYYVTYCIEPMLELLWLEDAHEDTRYKVLLPITTPPMSRPPQVIDREFGLFPVVVLCPLWGSWNAYYTLFYCLFSPIDTVHKERIFRVQLRICSDVDLVNITFSNEVLSVAECNARHFRVREHGSQNGTKTITLQVPFSDPVVLQRVSFSLKQTNVSDY